MRDRVWITLGLVVFLVGITYPIWFNNAAGVRAEAPVLRRPVKGPNCVAPLEYMRASHMELLKAWRDEVVRQGNRRFVAFDGRTYTMSLSKTCLDCHDNRAEFCDRCHSYAGVSPYCWDCHVDPRQARTVRAWAGRPQAQGWAR